MPCVCERLGHHAVGETQRSETGHVEGNLPSRKSPGKRGGKAGLGVGGRPKLMANNELPDTELLYVYTYSKKSFGT